jgi:hypothetical protein
MSSLVADTRLGSDHCPLILHSWETYRHIPKHFYFWKQWILQPGFVERVNTIWEEARANHPHRYGPLCDALDEWQHCIHRLRHHLRGRGANMGCQMRVHKDALMSEIKTSRRKGG